MGNGKHLFTSESVSMGHPDKVADQISDAVLDAFLAQDKYARVACETLVTTGLCFVSGEITSSAYVDIPGVVRNTIREIGYVGSNMGFDGNTCAVLTSIDEQSADIAQGVDEGKGLFEQQGAGDQGLMFGYACNETAELMPLPITLAHNLVEKLAQLRQDGTVKWLRPDGKSQVTVEYDGSQPIRVDTVVISTQHSPDVSYEELQKTIVEALIRQVVPHDLLDNDTRFLINPTGRFVSGGPMADTGLTGRKIIVDTYGGKGSHGGGAFSGKDPTKVDRSASYMARYIAKNLVAAQVADSVEVQLAYAIGVAEPVSVLVDTKGSGRYDEIALADIVRDVFPLSPRAIIEHLDLRRPIYKETARHGHFGRAHQNFTWERTDQAERIRQAVSSLQPVTA